MKKEVLAMKDTDLVVKSNTLVSSRYKLEWSEHRLVLFLISKIDKDDEDFKEYVVSVSLNQLTFFFVYLVYSQYFTLPMLNLLSG